MYCLMSIVPSTGKDFQYYKAIHVFFLLITQIFYHFYYKTIATVKYFNKGMQREELILCIASEFNTITYKSDCLLYK